MPAQAVELRRQDLEDQQGFVADGQVPVYVLLFVDVHRPGLEEGLQQPKAVFDEPSVAVDLQNLPDRLVRVRRDGGEPVETPLRVGRIPVDEHLVLGGQDAVVSEARLREVNTAIEGAPPDRVGRGGDVDQGQRTQSNEGAKPDTGEAKSWVNDGGEVILPSDP